MKNTQPNPRKANRDTLNPNRPKATRDAQPSVPAATPSAGVTLIELSAKYQVLRSSLFRACTRLGIAPHLIRKPECRNHRVAAVTPAEAERIHQFMTAPRRGKPWPIDGTPFEKTELGYFYILQLEPEHDPRRIKFGFTTALKTRLVVHRTAAPFSDYLKFWPSRQKWEATAIDCLSVECQLLRSEVYRALSLDQVLATGDAFFALLSKATAPKPAQNPPLPAETFNW